ncbi:MAG: VWA domain-containing protein, partial [Gammaproteobacteria bacterium]|nr:VWA domain-containing protein [Gammaproteobacteria bacterium]
MALLSGNKCVLLLLMLIIPQWIYAAEDDVVTSDVADTRVLIDVSGSMKENDPANLRRPALRLLVGLLPKDSRAAVWTFAQFVNQQIPLGKVDEGWRERARESAGKIHSRGLYTDIEQVLKRSTEDWKKVDGKYTRHLVLLTDGMVDISKNSLKNAASRRRIIAKILPQLKKIGVKVHTIALSKRADHRLLKRLSGDTDGWYEQVDDADRLKRIFLRIFEKVAKPDTVPLKDNKFQ